jgi:hypothetical protein
MFAEPPKRCSNLSDICRNIDILGSPVEKIHPRDARHHFKTEACLEELNAGITWFLTPSR